MPFAVQRDGYILSPQGGISARGIDKPLTERDHARLQEAVGLGTKILRRFGIPPAEIFLGTLNAGHPGGMLPLSEREAESLHPEGLPENLYLADATLLPDSLGKPPILTILALARRVARRCLRVLAGSSRTAADRG
jgi:choline dehydrogenase-like flavoprotein